MSNTEEIDKFEQDVNGKFKLVPHHVFTKLNIEFTPQTLKADPVMKTNIASERVIVKEHKIKKQHKNNTTKEDHDLW